jgi:hypothetical protein
MGVNTTRTVLRCQRPRVALYGIEGEHKANGPSGGGLDLAVTSIIPMVYPPKARLVRRTYRGFIGLNRQESQPVVNAVFIARSPHFPLCAGGGIFSANGVISELAVNHSQPQRWALRGQFCSGWSGLRCRSGYTSDYAWSSSGSSPNSSGCLETNVKSNCVRSWGY